VSESIFREPLPRTGIVLQQRVWNATPEGKDASRGDFKLIATNEKLWISNVLSIPLSWFVAFEPVGPGFRIRWTNKLTGVEEGATLCVRTFFGYDTARRDELVKQLAELSARARTATPSPAATSPANLRCERCDSTAVTLLDLPKITNFLVYWIHRTDRRLLCAQHAQAAIRANALRNALTGTIGIPGAVVTPLAVWKTAAKLSFGERIALTSLAVLPAVLLLAFVLWGITLNL